MSLFRWFFLCLGSKRFSKVCSLNSLYFIFLCFWTQVPQWSRLFLRSHFWTELCAEWVHTRLLRRMLADWVSGDSECWAWGLSCDWVVSRDLSSLRPLPPITTLGDGGFIRTSKQLDNLFTDLWTSPSRLLTIILRLVSKCCCYLEQRGGVREWVMGGDEYHVLYGLWPWRL